MTYAFLDTNVLLHYRFFPDIDWRRLLNGEVTLVFTAVVFKELDIKKWSGARKEKQRSKVVIKALDELCLSDLPVELRLGVAALAAASEPGEEVFRNHALQPSVADDRLLASLLEFRGENANHRVVLVTADAGLRVKARTHRIELVVLDHVLALPDEQDPVEVELAKATRELEDLRNSFPRLRVTLGGEQHESLAIHPVMPFDEATRSRLLGRWLSPYGGASGLVGTLIPGLLEARTEAESLCTRYLNDWYRAQERLRLAVPLSFVIDNVGTTPAKDIHLSFRANNKGTWHDLAPAIPTPPDLPRFGFGSPLFRYVEPAFPSIAPVGGDMEGPIVDDEDPSTVRFWVRRANHYVPVQLDTTYLQLDCKDDVRSFSIEYRLAAANLPTPIAGELHLVLHLGEPQALPEPPSPLDPNR